MAAKGRTIDGEGKRPVPGRGKPRRGPERFTDKPSRDMTIVAAFYAGRPKAEIAATFELTVRSVNLILEAFRKRPSALDRAPVEIIERALKTYEQQMEMWAALATRALAEDNLNAAAAGLKGHATAHENYLLACRALGKLPEDMESFRTQADLIRLGQLVLNALDDAAAGKLSIGDARMQVKALVAARDLPVIDAAAR